MRITLFAALFLPASFYFVAGAAEVAAPQPTSAQALVFSDRTLLIGHRGAAAQAPENTLASFRAALAAGADVVELDYFHTSDGVPVVFHDDRLERTTNAASVFGRSRARRPISSFTLEEIRQLDAGGWFDSRFQGEGIPTLAEALDVIQPQAVTFIEHKGGDAQTLIDLLREKEMLGSVVVLSFDWQFIAQCHELAPQLCLGCLGKNGLTAARLDRIAASGASIVGWKEADLGEREITAIHERGLRAWTYTVNVQSRARQLLADGIDGVITDDPVWLRDVIPAAQP